MTASLLNFRLPVRLSVRPARCSILAAAVLASLMLSLSAGAQTTPPKLEPLPEVPPPPGMSGNPDAIEPKVNVRQDGETKIEEYRVNGKLYAVRVTPKIGKPYILVDKEGKGTMSKSDDIGGGVRPPQWVLFEF